MPYSYIHIIPHSVGLSLSGSSALFFVKISKKNDLLGGGTKMWGFIVGIVSIHLFTAIYFIIDALLTTQPAPISLCRPFLSPPH